MTLSNGNVFGVTGHLCGEFTGPRRVKCHTRVFSVYYFLIRQKMILEVLYLRIYQYHEFYRRLTEKKYVKTAPRRSKCYNFIDFNFHEKAFAYGIKHVYTCFLKTIHWSTNLEWGYNILNRNKLICRVLNTTGALNLCVYGTPTTVPADATRLKQDIRSVFPWQSNYSKRLLRLEPKCPLWIMIRELRQALSAPTYSIRWLR